MLLLLVSKISVCLPQTQRSATGARALAGLAPAAAGSRRPARDLALLGGGAGTVSPCGTLEDEARRGVGVLTAVLGDVGLPGGSLYGHVFSESMVNRTKRKKKAIIFSEKHSEMLAHSPEIRFILASFFLCSLLGWARQGLASCCCRVTATSSNSLSQRFEDLGEHWVVPFHVPCQCRDKHLGISSSACRRN
jgi:hypothetical protein